MKKLLKNSRRNTGPFRKSFTKALRVESLEKRALMANNFLAGTAFIDSNSNGQLDTSEAYLPGAVIQLRTADGLTVLQTTTTGQRETIFSVVFHPVITSL